MTLKVKKEAVIVNKALTAHGESRSVVGTLSAIEVDPTFESSNKEDVGMAVEVRPCLSLAAVSIASLLFISPI